MVHTDKVNHEIKIPEITWFLGFLDLLDITRFLGWEEPTPNLASIENYEEVISKFL